MIVWLAVVIAAVALAVAMRTNLSQRRMSIMREVSDRVEGPGRYVDVGVVLHTVVADPNGKRLIHGKPKLRIVNTRYLGGIADTHASPATWTPGSPRPLTWYCSPEQEEALFHDDPDKLGQLIYGSEGAGKTRLLCMWHYLRWLEHFGEGREGGQTAPTLGRLGLVKLEMQAMFPRSWRRFVERDEFVGFELCDGSRVRFRYTHQQSAAKGAPIQGYNWSWCGRDEMQDQVDAHEDIESRGRAARLIEFDGREIVSYKQLATATAKDSPEWRTLRDVLLQSGTWIKRELSIFRSPFIGADFLAKKQGSMTEREFRRRYGNPATGAVEDLAPELALYFAWRRKNPDGSPGNLRPIPITARKITSLVLRKKTGNPLHALLAGHDPGHLKGATIYLDAYQLPGRPDPVWWVRGERMHRRQTTEDSGKQILSDARERGCNVRPDGEIVHVRAQPVGQSEDKPSEDLYRIFRRVGLDVRAAQYKRDGTGTGVIKKDDRIELVNWLFEKERLFIECDDRGVPVAPNLVKAIESMERDEKGRAEWEKKDESDLSDCPAALGYALWPFEKASAAAIQQDVRRSLS